MMKPLKYQLKNGLTVILAESRKSPVLAVQMWVRTGSADESQAQAGISHFIEHLVFKGTRKFGVGEIASTVEGSGGELNAYTSFDQTVFHVTTGSDQSDSALEVISEMMGYPRFDPEEVDREREVVIEEIKRGQDSPGRRNSQLLFSSAYKKHPYGRPVIGFEKVIKTVSVPTLKKYYQDRYCPRNMFLLITGDFDRPDMKKKVETHFAPFVDNAVRKVKRTKEPKSGTVLKIEKAPFKETHVNFCWRIPSVTHKDVPALDALALILGQGDSSRLTHGLRIEEALVHSVGASAFTPLDEGLFTVTMTLDQAHAARAMEKTATEIHRFLEEGPNKEELAKAIVGLASDTIYSLETVDGLARSYGSMEFYLRDPMAYPKYLKTLSALTPKDLLRVARKYLTPNRLLASGLTDGDTRLLQKGHKIFKSNYYPAKAKSKISATKAKSVQLKAGKPSAMVHSKIQRVSLPGGGFVLLKPQKETPTVSFRMALGGGLAIEPDGKEGTNELLSRTWSGGGTKFDEVALNHEIDAMAAGLSTFSGRNTFGLNADYISSFDKRMWAMIEDLLTKPALAPSVFERERSMLLRQISLRKDHPSYVCMRAFTESLYAGHPYSKETHGTVESLPVIGIQDLETVWSRAMTQGNFGAALVGDFDVDIWIERLTKLTKEKPKGSSLVKEFTHQAPKKDVRLFSSLQKEQSHMVLGMRGLGLKDPRRWALQVMQAVLAGQGGRLFIELRDKKSLAYSVSPIQMEGLGTGTFGAYIACSPEKAGLAEKMIRIEFAKLAEHRIPDDELQRARKYLSGHTAIGLQRKSAISSSILFDEIYGNDPQESLSPQAKYAAVTAEDIRSLAQDLFSRPTILSLVGPEDIKA